MSISQYSPDGKFESGSFMNGMWSGPQGTDPRGGLFNQPSNPSNTQNYQGFNQTLGQPNAPQVGQGLMGLGQQPQGEQYIGATGNDFMPQEEFGVPSPFMNQGAMQGAMFRQEPTDPNYVQRNYTTQDVQTAMQNPEFDSNYYQNANVLDAQGNPMSAQARQQLIQPFFNQQQSNPVMQEPQRMPAQSFFSGPNAGQIPMGFNMVDGEMVKTGNFNERLPTPQPPQFFQPQPMQQPMQPQGQPVNTQSVQPNFMGQTPFGQPQTGQFTSTNPFVQAAQANAQGNIAGALQATAANRINQQTPYGSLSYQQTGTDAQGNPIWSANQQLSPELQQLTQSSLAGLQASQANPMYGINPGDTYSNAIMQRLAPQQSQAREALDAQLANQGIMPGSEAYNRAKTLLGQTQNDALTSAIVGGMQTGLQAQGLQNTTAANIRNLATPGYVTPYNQAAVAGPDYLSAYTSQNATDIARANAEAAQRSSLLGGLAGLGSSAILGGTGPNSALGGLYGLGSKGLEALGNTSLWNSLFGTGPAITGDQDFLKSIGLAGSTYGSGTGGMLTDPLADLYTNGLSPEQNLSDLFNSSFGFGY